MRAVIITALSAVAAAGTLLAQAQHTYSPGDVEDGRRLFLANCAICHGPEGDRVPGVDMGHGRFRSANSDDEIVKIIRAGIPGTAMPPHNLPVFRAEMIVAYLRSMASSNSSASVAGDVVKGRAIFEGKGGCLNCHRVNGTGSRVGPDLSDIGSVRRAIELKNSILDPDAEVLPQNRYFRVVTKDGSTITGRLLNQDAFTVQLLDSHEQLKSFSKTDLKEYAFVEKSPMPSYQGKLSPEELTDLVSYLVSLKGVDQP